MPWKETCRVDERLRFVARVQEGEKVKDLCAEYGISRKTGHKMLRRYREEGPSGLEDQSRAPDQIPHRTSEAMVAAILKAKRAHMTWGPKKLQALLLKRHSEVLVPSPSTIGYWLKREGLVQARGRRPRATPTPAKALTASTKPNGVWCADFKGEFQLADGRYCYPLTITDLHSRYLISCTALESTAAEPAREAFVDVFKTYGLPEVIRTDNGCPFASTGIAGLSKLSALWLRLGIRPERIEPGHPEQNGQHERMHLTLKKEATRPASSNFLAQQERFDSFREEFNEERPHEALGQRPPATLYTPSPRLYVGLPAACYPLHDVIAPVGAGGLVYFTRRQFFLGEALAGQSVGLRECDDGRWLVTFMELDLGHYDERTHRFERS